MLDIQISLEDPNWPDEEHIEALSKRVLEHTVDYLKEMRGQPFPDEEPEVSLLLTDDEEVRAINGEWRGIDKPTNVLSFPAFPVKVGEKPGPMLGDIIFAFETVCREAEDLDKSLDAHMSHLLVHGFLHLLGFDHVENDDAELMEGLETRILAGLGLSDPYADSDPV